MRTSTTFGDIHYDISGQGPPLLLVHGTPFSSAIWEPFRPVLEQHFTVYTYDLLGYGQSAMPEGDVSLGVQNEVLAELLDYWGLKQPMVVAHDFGGATVLRSIVINGQQYERLLLIDVVALSPWGSPFVQHVREHEAAFNSLPDYIHQALVERYIQDALHGTFPAEAIAPLASPWLSAKGKAGFYRQIAQMNTRYTDEVQGHYGQIQTPAHLLWGEEDHWVPIDKGRALKERIPGATFQPIPDAGHLAMMDQPLQVLGAMLQWLRPTLA